MEALSQAAEAIDGDITGMTTSLGVAFNSTFTALLLSIMHMFFITKIEYKQDNLIVMLRARFQLNKYLKRKQLNPFSLSFIDIMACGLGAVALMFIFVKEATYSPLTESFEDEILPLEAQIENIDNLIESKTNELSNVQKSIDNVNSEINSAKLKTEITNNVIDNLVDENTNLTSVLEQLKKSAATKYKPVKKI